MESLDYVSCPISPITNVDDDDAMWFFQDFLTKLAPLTTTNSFTGMNSYDAMPFSLPGPAEDDTYVSSISASESSPEVLQVQQQSQQQQQQQPSQPEQQHRRVSISKLPPLNTVHEDKELDLSVVNDKLAILKNDDNLTSLSLENIFDTKDILVEKVAPTSRYHHHHNNHSAPSSNGNSISGPSANSPLHSASGKLTSQVPSRSNSIESTFSNASSQSSVCSYSNKQSPVIAVKMEPAGPIYQENNTPETTPMNTPVLFGGKTSYANQQTQQQQQQTGSLSPRSNAIPLSASINLRRKRTPRKKLTDTQKQAHNKIEKKYRTNINAKIAGLQQIIPWVAFEKTAFDAGTVKMESSEDMNSNSNAAKLNKSMILEKATDYILQLQRNELDLNQQIERLRQQVLSLGGQL